MLRSASSSSGLLLPACLGGQFRDFRSLLRCQPVRPGRTALEATRPLWTRRSGVLGCARRDVDDELAQLIGIARPLLFRESRHDLIVAHPGGRAAGCTLQTRSLPTEPGEGEDRTSCRIPAGRTPGALRRLDGRGLRGCDPRRARVSRARENARRRRRRGRRRRNGHRPAGRTPGPDVALVGVDGAEAPVAACGGAPDQGTGEARRSGAGSRGSATFRPLRVLRRLPRFRAYPAG